MLWGQQKIERRTWYPKVQVVEHGTLTPLVMSAAGDMERESEHSILNFFKILFDKWILSS